MSRRPEFDDADLTHPWATHWRIPLIGSPYPSWKYEVALVIPNGGDLWGAVWPTEQEAALVGWYIGFRREWYNERYRAVQASRALDVDSGTNTLILLKSVCGWHYRRMTYRGGVWPLPFGENAGTFAPTVEGLFSMLDHIQGHFMRGEDFSTSRWKAYRDTRPAVVDA